jgi:predicted DNA binding CopG/RHH family protein
MNITTLKSRQNNSENKKLNRVYDQIEELIKELETKEITDNLIKTINQNIDELNSTSLTNNELRKFAKKKQSIILKLVEDELKIVPKNYYRDMWSVIGMSAFGLPIGAAIGLSLGTIGLIAVGLPFGMAIGYEVGSRMDKKAYKEGRQLNIEVRY